MRNLDSLSGAGSAALGGHGVAQAAAAGDGGYGGVSGGGGVEDGTGAVASGAPQVLCPISLFHPWGGGAPPPLPPH